jgi:hypothetical protein
MTNESVFKHLEELVKTFERDVQLAKQLDSPNDDDDLEIKVAMVGFSYNSRTDDWDLGHFDFVRLRLARNFASSELAEYGPNAENVRLFFALSVGYLLGLYHQEELSDNDFRTAELLVSGLIMQHLGRLTARPVT